MLKDRQGSPLFLDQDPQGVPLDRCQSDSTEDKPQAHLSLTWAPCLTLHTDSTCLALGVLGLGTAFRTTASLCWAHLPQPCPLFGTEGLFFLDGMKASDKDILTKEAKLPKPTAVNKKSNASEVKRGEERFSSSRSWPPCFGECAYYTGEIRLKHGLKKKKSWIKNRLSCFTESPADETSSNFNSDQNHNSRTGKEGLLCLKSADT